MVTGQNVCFPAQFPTSIKDSAPPPKRRQISISGLINASVLSDHSLITIENGALGLRTDLKERPIFWDTEHTIKDTGVKLISLRTKVTTQSALRSIWTGNIVQTVVYNLDGTVEIVRVGNKSF